jgi:hypothetical protein
MRRDLFVGKLNPEKFSQRLQDLNKYLDYIPFQRTTLSDKTIKAYGKSLPEDEIRSIMGRAIPPEWKVNLLALGKELWRFKDFEDQMNMYHHQWQSDQQKKIIAKMAGKIPGKTNEETKKKVEEIITIQVVDAVVLAKAIPAEEVAVEEETTIVSI